MWIRIIFLDLTRLYEVNRMFIISVKMILALAFIPVEDVYMMATSLNSCIHTSAFELLDNIFDWSKNILCTEIAMQSRT